MDERIVDVLRLTLLEHLQDVTARHPYVEDWREALITYGDLLALAKLDIPARGISRHLTCIGDACEPYPRLDVLVINKKTRRPGRTFDLWETRVQACLAYYAKAT